MKKMMTWVLAATLTCGTSVFTACSNKDNAIIEEPEVDLAKQNRETFVEHTRAMTKDLAENLNFTSWQAANAYNTYFNLYVLNNPEFEKSILNAVIQDVLLSAKAVEEGSELAKMGFQAYTTIDLTNFNHRFIMNDDNTGFNEEPGSDGFEVLLNGHNPMTNQLEKGVYKVTMKAGGPTMTRILPMPNMEGTAMVIIMGSEFQFALSSKISGVWNDDFSGIMHYQVPEGATDGSKGYSADAVICSNILAGTVNDQSDNTKFELYITSDRVNGYATGQASWTQNGRKMMELSVKESGTNMGSISNLDMSQFDSASSIFEVIAAILSTRSIDEAKLTLLDDLTTTFSIQNLGKILEIENKYRTDGRNYADEATIEAYTKELNDMVKAEIYCKGLSQKIPMCLVTAPVGIDYWAVYGFQFSKQEGYVSLVDLLDRKTVGYMLNIMDHSVDYMQQSVIVGRQLVQYVLSLYGIAPKAAAAE